MESVRFGRYTACKKTGPEVENHEIMLRAVPILSVSLLLFPSTGQAKLPPDKAAQTFQVSKGLEYTLWAAEPLCVNPTSMDVDHRGRVWYCESINYRQKLRGQKVMRRPEGDRIVVLEDSKGDGKADKATVFYQSPEVHAPLGVAVYPYPDGKGQKVFVCQSPNIWVFEDKDGDLKADGPPQVLLTGFRGLDHDHGVHGVLVGPDNRLYFTVGDSGVGNLQSSDGKGPKYSSNGTDIRAATVWRCDLDGKNLELIAHNFRNNYEPCVNSFGTVFLSDNDDDGNQQTRICHVMPGGNYGYHPRGAGQTHWHEELPGIVPKILRTYFGSPTGICMYEGTLLPESYRGQILHTDAGPRHVRCYHLKRSGGSYAAEQENIVQSSDNWFRPSDVAVAPDGSVFVCDWYDPGVGGHGVGDFTMGRIYRLAPAGSKSSVPPLDLKNDQGILAALGSPNLARRALAMATLRQLGTEKAVAILRPAATAKADPVLRARALWQLAALGNMVHVTAALQDSDPRFRELALRILSWKGHSPADLDAEDRARIVQDPDAGVRREALLLLRNVPPEKSKGLILDLAERFDGKDRFYLAAIGIAAGNDDPKRRQEVLAGFGERFSKFDGRTAGLLWELRPPHMEGMLAANLKNVKLPEERRLQIVEILEGAADPKVGRLFIDALKKESNPAVRDRLVRSLGARLDGPWASLKKDGDLRAEVGHLLENADTRLAGLHLAGLIGDGTAGKRIRAIALSEKEKTAVRQAAIAALGRVRDAETLNSLVKILRDESAPKPLRLEAIRTVGSDWSWISGPHLLGLVTDAKNFDLELRQQMAAAISAHKPGADYLLQMVRQKKLAADLTPDLSRLLRNSPFAPVRNQASKLLPAPPKLDPKKLPSIAALASRKGNPNRGQVVLMNTLKNDAACLKCHTVRGVGGNTGPELSAIGSKASRENLLESILHPSRAIADQYVTWVVETKDGRTLTGILAEEQPDYILLRDAAIKEYKIPVKMIENKAKAPQSIMPDNLLLYLSEDELLDLVEYLYSLKSTPGSTAFLPAERRAREARLEAARR